MPQNPPYMRVRVGPPPSLDHRDHREEVMRRELRELRKACNARREELARDLLLKLVESNPQAREYNVRLAIEYTDALLAELDKGGA
jgi:hypothetical protein